MLIFGLERIKYGGGQIIVIYEHKFKADYYKKKKKDLNKQIILLC